MSDTVKLIIDIPEEDYNKICKLSNADLMRMPIFNGMALYGIKTGTLIDENKCFEGMTNGEVIKALFPKAEIEYWAEYSTYNIEFPNDNDVKHFSYSWWNAPYKAESEDKE